VTAIVHMCDTTCKCIKLRVPTNAPHCEQDAGVAVNAAAMQPAKAAGCCVVCAGQVKEPIKLSNGPESKQHSAWSNVRMVW
jgi:hypothetical protein